MPASPEHLLRPAPRRLVEEERAGRHAVVGGLPPAEHEVEEVLDEEPLAGATENRRLVLGHPQEAQRGAEGPEVVRRRSRMSSPSRSSFPTTARWGSVRGHSQLMNGYSHFPLSSTGTPSMPMPVTATAAISAGSASRATASRTAAAAPPQICAGSHTVHSGCSASGWNLSVGREPLATTLPAQVVDDALQARRAQVDADEVPAVLSRCSHDPRLLTTVRKDARCCARSAPTRPRGTPPERLPRSSRR